MPTIFDLMHQECDELVYRCAFACQSTNKETGIITPEEEDFVYLTVDLCVDNLKAVADNIMFWLSPSDGSNFRNKVAKTPGPNGIGYKAGRLPRPYHYQLIRDYFIKHYGAIELNGYEADDALGLQNIHDQENIVLSHIDKDIDMIPGWHYNYNKKLVYFVPEGLGTLELNEKKLVGRGLVQFYAQMLIGDRTDNIPGINRVGAARTYGLLSKLKTEKDVLSCIIEHYKKQYGDIWEETMHEVADLLWIVQTVDIRGSDYIKDRINILFLENVK